MFPDPNMWADDAKCATMNPDLFDVDTLTANTRRNAEAQQLCAGCPIIDRCLREALLTDTVGVVRGGVPFPNNHFHARARRLKAAEAVGLVGEVKAAIHREKTSMCRKGLHEMVGDNIEPGRDGTKRCRACSWLVQLNYRAKRDEVAA